MFILGTILLDAIGVGLIIPTLPDVIRRFSADPVFVNEYFGYFISVYALMQFVASPVLGSLSDRFGRRIILLCSLLGAGLDYLLMALAPNLGWLFVGRVVSGLTGASMTVASSYMADISNDSNRSTNFGLIGAGWGMGFILGPMLGGWLGSYGSHVPFYGAAVLNILNFVFGLFVLPESLPPAKRRAFTGARLNPLASLRKILSPSPPMWLIWIYLLLLLAGQSHPSIWTLYTQHKFGWTSVQVGLSLSFVGLSIGLVQGGLTRVIIPKLGEARSVHWGFYFYIVGFLLFAFATQGWMMYAVMGLFALTGISPPALQSLISRDAPPEEQGELQGSLMSIASLTAIVGPLLYTSLFARFTRPDASIYFPGVAYLVAAIISALALTLWHFRRKTTAPEPAKI
ncbi:MAG: TCR/Tet family MFS transporter [Bdellovibrionales bacterium]|nr:TCR/Tet family MFS transporter [Bdellovibrionales bacterium]